MTDAQLSARGTREALSQPAQPPVVALEHIRHVFGHMVAIDDLSLSIDRGEVVCLLGPSGCGKTTALRIAAGLEALQEGRVLLNGAVVADGVRDLPPEHRRVGFLFQDYALFPHMTVAGNVAFGLSDLSAAERRARVAEALAQVVLGDCAGRYPHELSGGQQQRVALARNLAPRPALVLLDEPFSGLDARMREKPDDVDGWMLLARSYAATENYAKALDAYR